MPLSRAWPAPTDRDVTTAADQKCHATRAVAVSLRKSSLASITVTAARTARSRAWPAQRTRWLRARLPRGVSHRHNRDHGGRSAPCARPKRCRSAPCARPGAGANVHALVADMARSYGSRRHCGRRSKMPRHTRGRRLVAEIVIGCHHSNRCANCSVASVAGAADALVAGTASSRGITQAQPRSRW